MKIPNLEITYNLDGVGAKNKSVIIAAIERMKIVLLSEHFLDALYSVIGRSQELEGELSIWKGATVHEIYHNLFDFNEGVHGIHLTLHTYYSAKRVIGYGYHGTTDIYINTKYLGAYTADDLSDLKAVGSNLIHEHGHDCGFEHDFKATARRKNSIAYLLNDAYEIAFDKIFSAPEIEKPEIVYYRNWFQKWFSWF